MGDQNILKLKLCALLNDYGSTVSYISRATKIDRSQLNKFKLGKLYLEPSQAKRLESFLAERGYSDNVKAFGAIIQGTFNN